MICAGIDAGSRAIKIVLLGAENGSRTSCAKHPSGRSGKKFPTPFLLAAGVVDQGVRQDALAMELFERVLREAGTGRPDVCRIVATGYGRNLIAVADTTITEITCHAAGVRHVAPAARTVIDIGGQDSKMLRLNADGTVRDFAMNDRCAAGTGRFLEVVAGRLGVGLDALGEMAHRSGSPAAISSTCVVFAETEITGLLASGASPDDIVAGVQQSIATRVVAMGGRNLDAPVVFTGGVAMVPGMAEALADALGQPVEIAPEPQMTGALGAALLAARQAEADGDKETWRQGDAGTEG